MSYRFIDDDGREQNLDGAAAFGQAVRSGRIRRDTLVNVRGHWGRADGLPEFQAASAAPASSQDDFWPIGAEREESERAASAAEPTTEPAREPAAPAGATWQSGGSYSSPSVSPAGGVKASIEEGLSVGARWLIAATLIILLASFSEPGEPLAYRLGYSASLVAFSWAVAWVILRWFSRGDIAVPIGAALLTALIAIPEAAEQDRASAGLDTQFDALESSISRATSDDMTVPIPVAAPAAGRSVAERIMWVTNQMLLDMEHMTDRRLKAYGVSDTAFVDFLTPRYLANAGRYPDVGAFFTRYERFVREWSVQLVDSMENVVGRRLDEAGFSGPSYAQLRRNYREGMVKGATSQESLWRAMLDLATSGRELHEFLVARSQFVFVDPADGMATFERDADFMRYEKLAARYDAAAANFTAAQTQWEAGMRQKSDSMRTILSSVR